MHHPILQFPLLRELTAQQRKGGNELIHGISPSYHITHHLQMKGLIKSWNCLLKAQVWRQLGDRPWKEAIWALTQALLYRAAFLFVRLRGPINQGLEVGAVLCQLSFSQETETTLD